MAGGRHRQQSGHAQQYGLAARGAPIQRALDGQTRPQERREDHQQAEADEPHVSGLRFDQHARDRSQLDGRAGAPLEKRRLHGEHDEAGAEDDEREPA